jgi:Family of unknown function (DUF6186)
VTWRFVSFAGFAIIAAAGAGWAVITAYRPNMVTIGQALRGLTRSTTARFLILAGWAWLGWHLFARGSGAFK